MTASTRMRRVAAVIGFVSATLAAMSALHLGGILAGGSAPFDRTHAGVAEATICVVLAFGALTVLRGSRRARSVALATTAFAIAGFGVGLNFTIRGGGVVDVAYHAAILPLLLLVAADLSLRRTPRRSVQA
jgi:hypothetical protein